MSVGIPKKTNVNDAKSPDTTSTNSPSKGLSMKSKAASGKEIKLLSSKNPSSNEGASKSTKTN